AGRFGLKTVKVAGTVRDSVFDVRDGNVNAVTVGRFVDSRLFLGYTGAGAFNTGGTFGPTPGTLNKFVTTAPVFNDPANPSNYAFRGSQIAADVIKSVRLSGLGTANGGTAFGIKFHTSAGSIRTAAAGPGAVPVGQDLTPATGSAGDFFLLQG
ncbi:MAG TPA: hypothetical protein VM597_14965, partial [Gemmataceae bacterium]|nr:hypothetical protein [Gemmataceae bacterium]